MALLEFLKTNENAVLARIEAKATVLAGERPTLAVPNSGLPIFFKQLLLVLEHAPTEVLTLEVDEDGMAKAANDGDEPAIAMAAGRPYDVEVAKSAGAFGKELQQSGYTLSHVVHAYGAACQAITELAIERKTPITTEEFRALNRCLDTAIAGAVTTFHSERSEAVATRETQNLGFLAHELRNTLSIVNTSLRLIKKGTVGFGGSIGHVLDRALKRQEELIDRARAEVRLRVDPKVHVETALFAQLIEQVLVAADAETHLKNQTLSMDVEPGLEIEADQYLLFSAVSNLVQNAIKYTCTGGLIRIKAHRIAEQVVIEVEDECGGLNSASPGELFKPFEQQHKNREGLGLGLTIAHRAIALNGGTIDVKNLPGHGCIFRISLPGAKGITPVVRDVRGNGQGESAFAG
ncbi:MAG: HAMP domain-containing histidine kinase [Steroidobacteraceae bacterium]|nr:HAMP domain-containing histidine kinase [Steroidobacteraceae bacterium]